MITSYSDLIHIIRLDEYKENIDRITDSLRTFDNITELSESLKITGSKLKEVNNKLLSIIPRKRTKRGLINGLGTIIKGITGNLDASDAERINRQIDIILGNENSLKSEFSQQTKLNTQMIERFGNITKHINQQQEVITRYLKYLNDNSQNQIRNDYKIFKYSQYLNQINYNIDLLNEHITGIAEAIVLAKLNIIPKMILNPHELAEINHTFENQNINITTIEHIYELLSLQAYSNGTNIIFNIRIPFTLRESYTLFHVIPLPIQGTKIIRMKPYLILNTEHTQSFDEKCNHIEGTFYCYQTPNWKKVSQSKCIAKIINNEPAQCELHDRDKEVEIFEAEPNHLIFINMPETVINTTCGPNNIKIRGTVLIRFTNCQITVNGITYISKSTTFWDQINIYPTSFNQINFTSPHINKLQLEQLGTYQFTKNPPANALVTYVKQKDFLTITTASICVIIVVIISLQMVLHRKSSIVLTTQSDPLPAASSPCEPTRIQFLWPLHPTKGGGVTASPTPHVPSTGSPS